MAELHQRNNGAKKKTTLYEKVKEPHNQETEQLFAHMRQHYECRNSESETNRAVGLQHMCQHSAEYRALQSEKDRTVR
ncbi:hypothetical protein JTB14_003185 [Gonioctena quinquepunctata]|nr:hypothetical protein JTB14_003185 [Gonioctena quinquepunctata]